MSEVTTIGTDRPTAAVSSIRPTPSERRLRRGVLVAILAGFLLLTAWLVTDDRVLEVIPGEIVRSGRLEPTELRQVVRRFQLRTIVSLVVSGPEDDWVDAEGELCTAMGVRHVTVPIVAGEWPARPQVVRLIELIDGAERPMLIHCLRGVDRVGWASAVSLLLADAPLERAMRQLSPRTGHLCDPDTCPLHRFFAAYRSYLVAGGLPDNGSTFRTWVDTSYCPAPYDAQLELLDDIPPVLAAGQPLRIAVRASNRGDDAWRMTDSRTDGVRLGARVIGPFDETPSDPIETFRAVDGRAVDIARSGLEPGVVGPGASRDFELRLRAPSVPGRYVLQIDMVDELVHWFSDLGWPGILRDVEVVEVK